MIRGTFLYSFIILIEVVFDIFDDAAFDDNDDGDNVCR